METVDAFISNFSDMRVKQKVDAKQFKQIRDFI